MAAVQLNFSLRTSSNVKTVHLLGSWDGYKGQLPLSKDASKAGSWKGTFRFQGQTLQLGKRYWYYYIMDGYHVSHDPAKDHTTEPTTGRKLNILDIPGGNSSSKSSRRESADVPKGRALSPSKIAHPKPTKAYASRQLREADYATSPVDELTGRFESHTLQDYDYRSNSSSSSSGSSLSSRSDGSSPSSLSSLSDPSSASSVCTCERYGITRRGDRVKLDCGGARCGYGDSSSCSESSEESSSEEEEAYQKRSGRAPARAPVRGQVRTRR